jgi:hypothetical protein
VDIEDSGVVDGKTQHDSHQLVLADQLQTVIKKREEK